MTSALSQLIVCHPPDAPHTFSLYKRVRCMPFSALPPPKRRNVSGRKHVQIVAGMVKTKDDAFTSIAIVRCVLKYTGFVDRPGGGEAAVPMLITSFLTGWSPILSNLIREDLLTTAALKLLIRFACTPKRLCVEYDNDRIVTTTTRCKKSNVACPFRSTNSAGKSCCQATHFDWMEKRRLRQVVREVGLRRFDRPIPGDDVPFAEHIVNGYLRPKQAFFAANDAAKAERERIGMPSADSWPGTHFQIRSGAEYPSYEVMATRSTLSGRVKELALRDHRSDAFFWARLRAHKRGWNLYVPRNTPHTITELFLLNRYRNVAEPSMPHNTGVNA